MSPEPEPGRTEPTWARAAVVACFAWLGARLVALALGLDGAVPPDESTHLGRILAHATTWGLPDSTPDNLGLGVIGDRPFLYYWVLGRLAAAGLDDLVSLRLVNAGLSLATAGYGLAFIRVLTDDPRTRVVFLVLLTNTLMLTGIGAAVSYDNGTNLLAAATFYHLARLLSEGDPRSLGATLAAVGLGCLAKRSFLPLAGLVAVAVLLHERRRLSAVGRRIAAMGRPLAIAVAVLAAANVLLYGSNLVRYGRFIPSFDQVVGVEAALANRIFARDFVLDGYREGRLSLDDARERIGAIDHPADRESTRLQLERQRQRGDWRAGPLAYARTWAFVMLERSVGYFGHRVLPRLPWERAAFGGVLAVALCFHLLAWRRPGSPLARPMGALALAYALVLLALVNYPTYVEKGFADAGVQGRYLFPVWVPLMGWLACALTLDAPRRLRGPAAGAACALFVWADAPSLWLRADPAWFG